MYRFISATLTKYSLLYVSNSFDCNVSENAYVFFAVFKVIGNWMSLTLTLTVIRSIQTVTDEHNGQTCSQVLTVRVQVQVLNLRVQVQVRDSMSHQCFW